MTDRFVAPAQGAKVVYAGHQERSGIAPGDEGRVVEPGWSGTSILFTTGSARGQIVLVSNSDLQATSSYQDDLDDSVTEGFGPSVHVAVASCYEDYGSVGLLREVVASGSGPDMEGIAEDVLVYLASRVRQDPCVSRVLAYLDSDAAEDFVQTTAASILRDALSVE